MSLLPSKRRRIAIAALVLLAAFLLRPGASRLKSRIIISISSAVGRSVDIGSVHVRLLPRPGFDLENLVVYDDPAFGAEPILRAGSVTAALRLTSLLRGRLEIARLDMADPSLNLVHGLTGGWNLEALLERTAHTPLAPTAQRKSEGRPGFPYIQASSARINFKNGPEKKPYALTNADFSLWQESENTWGIRLKAQPVRTDLNLNDTGVLRVSGTWQRAAILRDTPLRLTAEWSGAQLGQLTKLFTGNDQGWRGGALLEVTLAGTPANLQVVTDASLQDFRRYDITTGQALRLAAHCEAQYSSPDHQFHEVLCNAPVGTGVITLKGEFGLPGQKNYDLVVNAEKVPARAAAALALRAKKSLPEDLAAEGTITGGVSLRRNGIESRFRMNGQGQIADLRLASASNKAEIGPVTIPFSFTDALTKKAIRRKGVAGSPAPVGPGLEFGPFPLGPDHAAATVRGWITRAAYHVSLAGETDISHVLRAARLSGLPALQTATEGTAQLDLQVSGTWPSLGSGRFPGPQITGTAKLRNLRIPIRPAGSTVELASAEMQLTPDFVRVTKLSAKAANSAWTGSIEMPRGCGAPGACELHFNLAANQLAVSDVVAWASPHPKERAWYQVLGSSTPIAPTWLGSLRASGRIITQQLRVQNLVLSQASANVRLNSGKLEISDLTADIFGGKEHSKWLADFSAKPAVCEGAGSFTGVSLTRATDVMRDAWAAGTAEAAYLLKGPCSAEFWQSAEGTLRFDLRDGSLPRISLTENAGPLRLTRMSGQARLHDAELEMKDVKLDSADGRFQVSGTISVQRELELQLVRTSANSASGYAISGTVAEPHVVPLAGAEQAKLKTESAK